MKVNKQQQLQVLASLYRKNQSIVKAVEYLHKFCMIDTNQYECINTSLETSGDIGIIFDTLKIKTSLKNKILFLFRFYDLQEAISLALDYENNVKSLKKEITSSLMYPFILIVSTLLTMSYIINNLLPKLFIINGDVLVKYQSLIQVLKSIPLILSSLCILLLLACFIGLILNKYDKALFFKVLTSNKVTQLLLRKYYTLNFVIILKELLIYDAFSMNLLNQMEEYFSQSILVYIVSDMKIKFEQGLAFEDIINENDYLERDLKNILLVSADSLVLKDLLDEYLYLKIELYKVRVKYLLSIVVPIIILLCAIIIITLYMLIMLPTLEMN